MSITARKRFDFNARGDWVICFRSGLELVTLQSTARIAACPKQPTWHRHLPLDCLPIQSVKATRVGGRILLVGALTGRAGTVPTATLMARQQRLQGLIVGSRRHQMDGIRGIDAIHGHPVIDRSFPFAEIASAFRLQESGGHFGKIVIEF
ncbi:zinc-binding dehydrogenase [Pseudomonas sp.]|uniref:zinc-binding dehydrogenase n=1 Tax=Pseudomonas sp. TaxID=306 RepID=UPI00345794FF